MLFATWPNKKNSWSCTLLSDFIMRSKVDFKKSQIRGFDLKTYYLLEGSS